MLSPSPAIKALATSIAILFSLMPVIFAKDMTFFDTKTEEKLALYEKAYIYLYPAISMDMTEVTLQARSKKPVNSFTHAQTFPEGDFKAVVRPNFDTLYSTAFVDVSTGPQVLEIPANIDRFFILEMLDLWTDVFAVVSNNTLIDDKTKYLIHSRGWVGDIPEGMVEIEAPTDLFWILGRTATDGAKDYPAVHKIQRQYKLSPYAPLSGQPQSDAIRQYRPKFNTSVPHTVEAMPALDYFKYGLALMKLNEPHPTDWSFVKKMYNAGLDLDKLATPDTQTLSLMNQARENALKELGQELEQGLINGWQINIELMGAYANEYLRRAKLAKIGLGVNLPEYAIYPLLVEDSKGRKIDAKYNYKLHFEAEKLPPVDGFWSLTMYDKDGFSVPNEIKRYAIGDRDDLYFNEDGSLDIYFQHSKPKAIHQASNWLPSPAEGNIGITLRLYAPRSSALSGEWAPPAVLRQPQQETKALSR